MNDRTAARAVARGTAHPADDGLAQLLAAPVNASVPSAERVSIAGVVVGTLVGFSDAAVTPLVSYDGQPGTAALRARSTVPLDAAHIGRATVLVFEGGDPYRPIVVGCLQGESTGTLSPVPGKVEIEGDGERLTVFARDRIVLRCGKASITLTKEGKLILQGAYVSSQSSGVLRIKGGSVQIN